LTVTDIDGPGGDFVHWTIWNLDPTATELLAGAVPDFGTEGRTGRGDPGYFGPCPPSGEHHYVFELYALDEALDLDPATSGKAELLAAMQGHILDQAKLTGTYAR
jgi:Raf kinase inhibitor-like YbhB/YbcL family protein